MILPNSGRVVIVDNKIEEAQPLIHALTKRGMPHLFSDGKLDTLPQKPLRGTRFVFLDIELSGMEGQNDKTVISGLIGVLKKIIDQANGPYVILFWTAHQERIDGVLTACAESGIAPVGHNVLNKRDLLNGQGVDLDELWTEIEAAVSHIPAFQLVTQWENAVNCSTIEFINTLSEHFSDGTDWSRQASHVFHKLYKTHVEKREVSDVTSQFKHACYLMNRSYFDTLESHISQGVKLPDGFSLTAGEISADVTSKINTSLLINLKPTHDSPVGSLYAMADNDIKQHLIDAYFKKDKIPQDLRLCQIVITPECDFAQNKMLKGKQENGVFHYHRVVHALMWKCDSTYDKSNENGRVNRNDAFFPIGPLYLDGHIQMLGCHFASIGLCDSQSLGNDPLFSLRRDLLADLQSKAANHVNRLGNSQIKV